MPKARMNGTTIHYHVKGHGTPIVFIHPPLLTTANFTYQQVQLSGDFQTITFDIRGHGQSAPSGLPVTYSLIVADMIHLLNHLKIKEAYLCGYSTGGGVALEALLTYPERFLGAVIVSGMSEASTWSLKSEIKLARLLSSTKPLLSVLARAIAWGNADMRFTYKNLLKDAKQGHLKNIHQYYSASSRYNCTNKLSQIKQPVLLVYGEKDRRFRKYARMLEQGLPHSELRFIPGATHQLPTKEATTLNLLIRGWLREMLTEKAADRARQEEDGYGRDAWLASEILAGMEQDLKTIEELER
jgi:pimeloyl-ACP methyl ester carboxylesterase